MPLFAGTSFLRKITLILSWCKAAESAEQSTLLIQGAAVQWPSAGCLHAPTAGTSQHEPALGVMLIPGEKELSCLWTPPCCNPCSIPMGDWINKQQVPFWAQYSFGPPHMGSKGFPCSNSPWGPSLTSTKGTHRDYSSSSLAASPHGLHSGQSPLLKQRGSTWVWGYRPPQKHDVSWGEGKASLHTWAAGKPTAHQGPWGESSDSISFAQLGCSWADSCAPEWEMIPISFPGALL